VDPDASAVDARVAAPYATGADDVRAC